MSNSTSPKLTVTKSNDKAQKKAEAKSSTFRKNVYGSIEGKTLQEPLNDKPEYKNVDSADVRIPAPEDGSIPTWRVKNGVVLPMVKVEKEDGSFEYKPRKKKGPTKGKKYAPRAGKITKMLTQGMAPMQGTDYAEKIAKLNEDTAAHMPAMPSSVATDVFGDMSSVLNDADCVDFQALVHSWQMRSIGALNDMEFALIKKSIFEKRQTARAAMVTPEPLARTESTISQEGGLSRTESTKSDMTF